MEESNDSPQSNAKRVKYDMEYESITCTNTSDSDVNKDLTMPSSPTVENDDNILTFTSSPPKNEILDSVQSVYIQFLQCVLIVRNAIFWNCVPRCTPSV
ncbi:hypothetical protein HA402_015393 [Bradysia odoriphaga]|nr:hypothetical protein HA402_015393 [Bradysia odoriphaga]